MVQYLQNNVIMKQTSCFTSFNGSIPLKYGSTTTPHIIAHCQNFNVNLCISHCDPTNLQYKVYPKFDLLPDEFSKQVSIIRRVLY